MTTPVGVWPTDWVDTQMYPIGAAVVHGGVLYRAIAPNDNEEPPSASWTAILSGGGGGGVGPGTVGTLAQFTPDATSVGDATGITTDGAGALTAISYKIGAGFSISVVPTPSNEASIVNSVTSGSNAFIQATVADGTLEADFLAGINDTPGNVFAGLIAQDGTGTNSVYLSSPGVENAFYPVASLPDLGTSDEPWGALHTDSDAVNTDGAGVLTAAELHATNGATGTFTTVDLKTVTVVDGIITSIV